MKWFGRKAGRVAARPLLMRGWPFDTLRMSGDDVPRSYEALVREAYLANPVAQRAVRLVAEGVAGASVYDVQEEKGRASTGSARAVSIVSGPLLETVAAQLLLHGNAFVQLLCDAEGVPVELFALRPERVTIEPDASGWPAAYVYKAGAARMRLAAREPGPDALGRPPLVHLKAMHPLDDHYGLGCLGAAAGAVAIHNAATRFHNEALALIDAGLHPVVEGAPLAEPPAAPAIGQCWLVAAGASGAWEGRDGCLAAWTSGGWRYLSPPPGMGVWDKAAGFTRRWTGGGWNDGELAVARVVIAGQQVVGARQSEVPSPSGGTTIDQEARAAIAALTVALKTHGLID